MAFSAAVARDTSLLTPDDSAVSTATARLRSADTPTLSCVSMLVARTTSADTAALMADSIDVARLAGLLVGLIGPLALRCGDAVEVLVFEFKLEFFVQVVAQVAVDTPDKVFFDGIHGRFWHRVFQRPTI